MPIPISIQTNERRTAPEAHKRLIYCKTCGTRADQSEHKYSDPHQGLICQACYAKFYKAN